ncbi:MAG: RnfH family protein, partial [Pontibacterium sp.]
MIKVEVAYALPTEQKILSVQIEEDASAYDAVIRSGIVQL